MADRSKLDDLKDVLGGAARAIARVPDVELAYTAEAPSQAGQHLKVPMPARDLPAAQVAEARGFADSFSLKLRHHNEATHRKNAPQEAVARACFDALEQVRTDALGSRVMVGAKGNPLIGLIRRAQVARLKGNIAEGMIPGVSLVGRLGQRRLLQGL
jgi:cobaltochelatase CobT